MRHKYKTAFLLLGLSVSAEADGNEKKYWAAAVCLFTNCHFFDEVTPRLHPKPVDPQAYYFFLGNFVFKTQSFVSFLCNRWKKSLLVLSTKESEK
jgi:hypothetical protein